MFSRRQNEKKDPVVDEVKQFVKVAPNAKYTFDSERDAPQSELCRQPDGALGKECRTIQMHSTKLFATMQDLGFFCALPLNPEQTYIECTPIPK